MEFIVGTAPEFQKLKLQVSTDQSIELCNDDELLKNYNPIDGQTLHCTDTDPNNFVFSVLNQDSDENLSASKFVLSPQAELARSEKMNEFKNALKKASDEKMLLVKIGDACRVEHRETSRIGKVRYIGEVQFAPGLWVGVEFDCPIGKNDGTVQNVKYFESLPNHASFFKPNLVMPVN